MFTSRPLFWDKRSFLSMLLIPFSFLYSIVFELRFYFAKAYTSSLIKTVCVGNFTIGGSGKTPIVLAIAKYFANKKYKICIISRGYRGVLQGPLLVDKNIHNYFAVGDEAMMMSNYFPTIVTKNKLAGLKFAEDKGFDIAIFDDGLQNININYDVKITVFDSLSGNNLLLPAGPLREKLERAIIRSDAVFYSKIVPDNYKFCIEKWFNFKVEAISDLPIQSKKLFLFAGIGVNDKFFDFVEKLGGNIVEKVGFSDHYIYSNYDFEQLIKKAKKLNAKLVTTEKDFVKIPEEFKKHINYLPILCKIENLELALQKIL